MNLARAGEPDVTLEQIATDFGLEPITLAKCLRAADFADGVKPGASADQLAELP